MSSVIFTRGAVAGLGAAAGTFAVAALLGTAPIANADNTGNEIDWATLASPAATFPELTYSNVYILALGNTVDTWTTTFTGSGLPTTVETTQTLTGGAMEWGSADTYTTDLFTSAGHGDQLVSAFEALALTSGGSIQDFFLPLETTFTTF